MPKKLPFPAEVVRAFQMHRWNAKRRGIAFLFTIDTWYAWWLIDDRWSQRGRTGNDLVMARHGDVGPYSPENVYCATQIRNIKDICPEKMLANVRKAGAHPLSGSALRVKGGEHPKAKGVRTPAGYFSTATSAAEHYGITRQHAARKAREGIDGWTYSEYR